MKTSPNIRGPIRPSSRSDEYGELQRLVDEIYRVSPSKSVSKVDVVVEAEVLDLDEELMEVMDLIQQVLSPDLGSATRSTPS